MASFKVDENLPAEATSLLKDAGHDALSVHDQEMVGSADSSIAAICRDEKRALVTLDLDFADIRGYPPEDYEDNKLYKIAAEWNGDGGVSIFDFSTFSYWYGRPVPIAPAYVDLNLDGGISIFDFPIFSSNFGSGVVFPPPLRTPANPVENEQQQPHRTRVISAAERLVCSANKAWSRNNLTSDSVGTTTPCLI